MNKKLFSLTIFLLVNFTAATNCMNQQAQIQKSTVPTLKQLVIEKIASELIQPGNLQTFIENPQYATGLIGSFSDKDLRMLSNTIARRIVNKTIIPTKNSTPSPYAAYHLGNVFFHQPDIEIILQIP